MTLAFLVAAAISAAAFEPLLDPQSLGDAIRLGQSAVDDVRTRFHAPYHIDVMQPPVDYIEVVTPFRRIALDAEAHARAGDRAYGQRGALATLGDDPSRVDVVFELTFHPLNTLIGVPDYSVTLQGTGAATMQPRGIVRLSRFGPRLAGMLLPYPYTTGPVQRNGSQPLLGASVIATFDGKALDAKGVYVAVMSEAGKDVARATIDLGKFR